MSLEQLQGAVEYLLDTVKAWIPLPRRPDACENGMCRNPTSVGDGGAGLDVRADVEQDIEVAAVGGFAAGLFQQGQQGRRQGSRHRSGHPPQGQRKGQAGLLAKTLYKARARIE